MKKIAVLLCAIMLAFSIPVAAFGEAPDTSIDIMYLGIDSDLGATGEQDGDSLLIKLTKATDLKSGGIVAGTIAGFEVKINKVVGITTNFRGPNTAVAPKPYAVDKSKTVLNAAAFDFQLGLDNKIEPTIPGGASIVYTYQANQKLVSDLASENGIEPSDIKLYVYEEDMEGKIQKLVNDWPSDKSVEVKTNDLRTGDFVMALACDSSLLSKAEAQPKPKPKPKPSSSSETFVGIDPVEIPVVAAGEDESDLSPKTGQALPSGTAPAALLVAAVLGGGVVIAVRRRSMR